MADDPIEGRRRRVPRVDPQPVTDHVTDHVSDHGTEHVTDHVTDQATGPVTERVGTVGPGDSIRRPLDEETTYRLDASEPVVGVRHRGLDIPATLGGALAALGTLLILASIVGAVVGSFRYQTGVGDDDLSIGGVIAGLVVLFLACVVGGWVAARIARHREGLHGLLAPLWLLVIAGVVAALAAIFGDDLDVTDDIGLPNWFDEDAFTIGAIVSGVLALLLMLLGGYLGGLLARRHHHDDSVRLLERRRAVATRPGGIVAGSDRARR